MFLSTWTSLLRILAVGIPAYVCLILLLRLSGKRTLSKFNAFDLVVTVAFGSTLSAGLVSKDVALADIVVAFALLVALQLAITWSSVRWRTVSRLVKAEPRLLFHRGEFMDSALKGERITEGEVLAAIRLKGVGSLDQVDAVVLETDGTFSVITDRGPSANALKGVIGHAPRGDDALRGDERSSREER